MLQGSITAAQEVNVIVTPDKTHVRHSVNKAVRIMHYAAVNLVRPELTGDLERFVDLHGFLNADRAVFFLRGVVQLH